VCLTMIFVDTHDVCETCKCLSKVVSNVTRLASFGRTQFVPQFFHHERSQLRQQSNDG